MTTPTQDVRRRLLGRGSILSDDGSVALAIGDFETYVAAVRHRIGSSATTPDAAVRGALADVALCAHEQFGTMTPGVSEAIGRLRRGAPVLRVSHQPNVMAGLNVLGLPLLQVLTMRALTDRTPVPVVLLVLVDHDAAGDRRFRAPQVPRPNAPPMRLGGAVAKQDHEIPMGLVQPISAETALSWSQQLEQATTAWWPVLRARCPNISAPHPPRSVVRHHVDAFARHMRRGISIADGSASFNSYLLNEVLALDVLCIPESRVLRALARDVEDISRQEAADDPDTVIWVVCDRCFKRRAASATIEANGEMVARWSCSGCSSSPRAEAIRFDATISRADISFPRFLPRVGLSDRLDLELYGAIAAVSYAGGAEHTLNARRAAVQRGTDLPPEFIWEPAHIYGLHDRSTDVIARARCPTTMYCAWTPEVLDVVHASVSHSG